MILFYLPMYLTPVRLVRGIKRKSSGDMSSGKDYLDRNLLRKQDPTAKEKLQHGQGMDEAQIKDFYQDFRDSEDETDEMKTWVMNLNNDHLPRFEKEKKQLNSGLIGFHSSSCTSSCYEEGQPGRSCPGRVRDEDTRKYMRKGAISRSATFHEELALQHFDRGNEHLKKLLDLQDDDRLMTQLHCHPHMKHDLLQCTKSYSLAIEHTPKDQRLYINRCIAYELAGKLDQALADAEKAHELCPGECRAVYRLARMKRLTRDVVHADALYIQCHKETEAIEVWREMVNARLEYMTEVEKFTDAEIGRSHILADNMPQALAYARAVRHLNELKVREQKLGQQVNKQKGQPFGLERVMQKYRSAEPATSRKFELREDGGDDDDNDPEVEMFMKKMMKESRQPLSDFILLDQEQAVKEYNSQLLPTNVFGTRGIVLYGCTNNDPKLIRLAVQSFGKIMAIDIGASHVVVAFTEFMAPVLAISRLHGATTTGLTDEGGDGLTVRFLHVPRMTLNQRIERCRNQGVCYNWRTTGCDRGIKCHFKHLPADYMVNCHPFMKKKSMPSGGVAGVGAVVAIADDTKVPREHLPPLNMKIIPRKKVINLGMTAAKAEDDDDIKGPVKEIRKIKCHFK